MTSGSKRSVSIVKGWVTSVKHGLSRLRLRVPVADFFQVLGLAIAWYGFLLMFKLPLALLVGGLTLFLASVAIELVKVWASDG